MRFDSDAYAKLFPRKKVVEVPESSVETFHSDDCSDDTNETVVEEGETDGDKGSLQSDSE